MQLHANPHHNRCMCEGRPVQKVSAGHVSNTSKVGCLHPHSTPGATGTALPDNVTMSPAVIVAPFSRSNEEMTLRLQGTVATYKEQRWCYSSSVSRTVQHWKVWGTRHPQTAPHRATQHSTACVVTDPATIGTCIGYKLSATNMQYSKLSTAL